MNKINLPSKVCETCRKPFNWRKKWKTEWPNVKYCSEKCRRERKAGLYIGSLEKTRKGNLSKTTSGESFKPLYGNTISAADDTSKKVLDSTVVIEPKISSKQARQQWFKKKTIGNKDRRK
jgi:hypothetical protein|tara:strand:- start:364 stop:723 length:360 start_codon:yes stop_codon:yes gene_type:complete